MGVIPRREAIEMRMAKTTLKAAEKIIAKIKITLIMMIPEMTEMAMAARI